MLLGVLLPLLIRHVNPTYAARLIEQSQPSLKNSLISFLFLRPDRQGARGVVYRAMQERAAADISGVQVDAAVDRSRLIHVGYVLAGMLAIGGLYAILSPKDPFQTVARILAPWKGISRPSRVQILEVSPGNADAYQGRAVEVSVLLSTHSATTDTPVYLVYNSSDGRIENRRVRMRRPESQLRHRCDLPDDDAGVQQDLMYRIEAGDAATEWYRIHLLPAPSMVVQQIEYEYPAYTGRKPLVVPGGGDVEGLEGTRVKVVARANQQIESAYLEFDADTSPDDAQPRPQPAAGSSSRTIPMTARETEASVRFTLYLQEDRRVPLHSSYRLRFATADGETNRDPVLHRIDVVPDLPPIVEILDPQRYEIEVPENGSRTVEVRAVDPDFALSSVVLRATSAGKDVLEQPLLSQEQAGQFTARFELVPRKLGLARGDEAVFWAAAADNRMSPNGSGPASNTSRTTDYRLRVVAAQGSGAAQPTTGERQQDQQQGQPAEGDPTGQGQPSQPGQRGSREPTAGRKNAAAPDDQASPDQPAQEKQQPGETDPADARAGEGQQSDRG